jgi:hypothetical protein
MATSIIDGPQYTYGNMGAMSAATFGMAVADPNTDNGPNAVFQGQGMLDMRYWFAKDMMQGYAGRQPVHLMMGQMRSVNQIPAAFGTAKLSALAPAASGTPFTLVTANSTGISVGVPMMPFNQGGINNGTPTNSIVLDMGFAFGTCTSGSTTIVVANAYDFFPGMPIVIAGAGNAGGTLSLQTFVTGITDTTHITVFDAPLASPNPAAIATGNIWGPSEFQTDPSRMRPTAVLPWFAGGPGLFLDPRQAIARCVSVTGSASATGGNVVIRGADIYGVPMSETIAAPASATTVYGVKAFKYIFSATPAFTDAGHNYSVGTGDTFGLHYRGPTWEDTEICWNATSMTTSAGYVLPLALITASTATTADVRGTVQVSANGASGTTIVGPAASDGTVSGLAMSGKRLMLQQSLAANQVLYADPGSAGNTASAVNVPNSASVFGNAQFTS